MATIRQIVDAAHLARPRPARAAGRGEPATVIDCGTGRQVADWLAAVPPTCPVIVHSSNEPCAAGMVATLADAGWPCRRLYPYGDLIWIEEAWAEAVRELLMR